MISVILWKEYREHLAIWSTLAFVAIGVLVGIPWVFPPEQANPAHYRDMLSILALILAWTYGNVCGAMLLAGERENQTEPFLDTLPLSRLSLWKAKVLAGLLFLGLQIAVIATASLAHFLAQDLLQPLHRLILVLALAYAGLLGLGWSLLFSSRSRSVLGAIGLSILAQILLFPLLNLLAVIPLLVVTLLTTNRQFPIELSLVSTGLLALVLPWPVSRLLYRSKGPARSARSSMRVNQRIETRLRELRALLWLVRQQTRGFVWGAGIFALIAGCLVVPAGLYVWPLASLLLGALCGATVFLDEQSGAYRFVGEQRLPLGRFWLVKLTTRLLLALGGLFLLLLPSLFVFFVDLSDQPLDISAGETVSQRLLGSILFGTVIPTELFVFAPMLYGFALGHVAGIIFRKALVALVVAVGLGILLFSVWVPSLVAGGLHAWQVLSVPVFLVLGVSLLLRPWVSDRLLSFEMARNLGILSLGCVAWTTLGLWYRLAEVPDVPEPAALQEFVASLPAPEHNQGGSLTRNSLSRVDLLMRGLLSKHADRPLFPQEALPERGELLTIQAALVLSQGWPEGAARHSELAEWLDEVFRQDWWKPLAEATEQPVGVVLDPRRMTMHTLLPELESARVASILLAARGLQLQQTGDPARFLEHLDMALTLVRNMENKAPEFPSLFVQGMEQNLLSALDQWLAALSGHPQLLQRLGQILARHRDALPADGLQARLATYLVAQETIQNPTEWLRDMLHQNRKQTLKERNLELLVSAWRIPWEQQRQQRLLRAVYWDRSALSPYRFPYLKLLVPIPWVIDNRLEQPLLRRVARIEAARLKVALRQYQALHGRPARSLDQLLPDCLVSLPPDPYDGSTFRYRLSTGERIHWPITSIPGEAARQGVPGVEEPGPEHDSTIFVPAGQGILWSVGEDRRDDGGKIQGLTKFVEKPTSAGEDLIYLVPLPARK